VAGSAYTFSYASLGELVAWIIGWDLMLELALGAATLASGWSQYFQVVLTSAPWHAHPPAWIFADHHNLVAGAIVLVTYRHSRLAQHDGQAQQSAPAQD
jgi:basic amino acid/polyamine antiporter, APA family